MTTWQIVHSGTLVFIGLMGLALYQLVATCPAAPRRSVAAIGPFVLLYGAYEAVIGLATGALVQHANDVPADERPAVSGAIQGLQYNVIVGDPGIVGSVGAIAWITAALAAAFAYRRARAPLAVCVLLGVSAIVVSHPPPFGPVGLVCFAAAVGVAGAQPARGTCRSTCPSRHRRSA